MCPLLRACNFWNIVSYFIVKIFNIVTVVRGQGVETKKEIWLTMASIKKKWKNVPMSLLHHKARWGHVSPGWRVWRVTVRRPGQWQYRSGASHYLTRHQPSISDYISHSHKYLVVMVDMVFQHLSAYVDYVESVAEELSPAWCTTIIEFQKTGMGYQSIYLHVYFDFGIFINQGISISGQNMSKEVSKNDKIRMIIM